MTPIETVHATWNDGDPLDGFLEACRQVVIDDDDIEHLAVVAQLLGQQVMSTGEGQALKSKARRKVDNTIAEMHAWAPNLMCGLESLEKMVSLDRQQQPPRFFDDFENRKRFLHDPLVQMMWLHRLDYDVVVDDTVWTKRYAKSTIQSFDHMPARVPWLVAGWFGYYHEQTYEIVKRALGKGDSDYLKEAVRWWDFALSCERTGNPLQEKAMAGYQAKVNQYGTFREKARNEGLPTLPPSTQATKKSSAGCFVATAASGDPFAPEVMVLSAFRDDVLSASVIGRAFIRIYYLTSPTIAVMIARSVALRGAAMTLIVRPAVRLARAIRSQPTLANKQSSRSEEAHGHRQIV